MVTPGAELSTPFPIQLCNQLARMIIPHPFCVFPTAGNLSAVGNLPSTDSPVSPPADDIRFSRMPVKTPLTLGHRLRNARLAKGLTQRQSAKTLGTHTQSIGNGELGPNRPRPRHLTPSPASLGALEGGMADSQQLHGSLLGIRHLGGSSDAVQLCAVCSKDAPQPMPWQPAGPTAHVSVLQIRETLKLPPIQ